MQNTAFSIGAIALIDKVNKDHNLFNYLFDGLDSKQKQFVQLVKLLIHNKLNKDVSEHQILNVYPKELWEYLGFNKQPKERTIYRSLESIGKNINIVNAKVLNFLKENKLLDKIQHIDWSSVFFQGKKADLAKYGYSRDHRPDKKQVAFGVTIGNNNISSIITIQKGNVVDKIHLKRTLKIIAKVFEKNTLLVFDCGANTKENRTKIKKMDFNYLSLKQKKKTAYKKYIKIFKNEKKTTVIIKNQKYTCVKVKDKENTKYIFFSKKRKKELIKGRNKRFIKELEKNKKILTKVKKGKEIKKIYTDEGYIILEGTLQKIFGKMKNPKISGIEGFFILESSLDEEPTQILKTYKNRDKTEKIIKAMKDGLGLRPIRHTNKNAIAGKILITYLANLVICLTLKKAAEPLKNKLLDIKLLKKIVNCLTLTRIYQKVGLRIIVLSNITPNIKLIFGGFIKKYEDKSIFYSALT